MGKSKQPWVVQWHITADGSAIKSYQKALDHSNPQREPPPGLEHLRYATTRRLQLSDLHALEADLAAFYARFNRLSTVVTVAGFAGLVGVVLSWLVFPIIGFDGAAASLLFTVSIPLLALGVLGVVFVPGVMSRRHERLHTAHGLASSNPEVLKEPEARMAIDAPGTLSEPDPFDAAT